MQEKLQKAIEKCDDINNKISDREFRRIYPFTTENISAYFKAFQLRNKTLLTIGSSVDEAINANLFDAKEVTIMDNCLYTKEYFYLKKAAIEVLNYQEFLDYFCRIDNEGHTFSKEKFQKLSNYLAKLDKESFLFWNELYKLFPDTFIRDKLFKNDEENRKNIIKINPYLNSENDYLKERVKIKSFTPIIIPKNIKEDIIKKFDNIFLSNIAIHMHTKDMVETYNKKIENNLNNNGKILIRYMYHCLGSEKLDIEKFFYSYFDDLVFDFKEDLIPGVDEETCDGILTYQKKK